MLLRNDQEMINFRISGLFLKSELIVVEKPIDEEEINYNNILVCYFQDLMLIN